MGGQLPSQMLVASGIHPGGPCGAALSSHRVSEHFLSGSRESPVNSFTGHRLLALSTFCGALGQLSWQLPVPWPYHLGAGSLCLHTLALALD